MEELCVMCDCRNIQLIRQHGYISEAIKSVKLFKCLSCKKYFIAIVSYCQLQNNEGGVDCIYYMHPMNRTRGHRWFRILTRE